MGENFEVIGIEVIQGGTIQLDAKGDESGDVRIFIEPGMLMDALRDGMKQSHATYMASIDRRRCATEVGLRDSTKVLSSR